MSKIEDEVCEKIQQRAEVGLKKYGTTMEREDFSDLDWMNYLQEELMDGAVYLQRMINNYQDMAKKITIAVDLLPEKELQLYIEAINELES
tara:strand:- start:16645 stop:16917 length:273 start_codon:yes stop_codon:yes gene_type:complete